METPPQTSLEGLIYQITYSMQQLRLFNWTLTRWAVLVVLAAPALMAVGIVPGGRLGAIAVGAMGLAVLVVLWQANRRAFLRFEPHPDAPAAPAAEALPFPQKITVSGSGLFAVGKAARHWVSESALYQTFPTRERVVMVNIPWRRHALVVQSSPADVGWWYAFFSPTNLRHWQTGRLIFGRHPKPALALTFTPDDKPDSSKTIYLSTNSVADMRALATDLLVDCGHARRITN